MILQSFRVRGRFLRETAHPCGRYECWSAWDWTERVLPGLGGLELVYGR